MEKTDSFCARKPAGGFAFITVVQICAAWTAYRERRITLLDLRAWFACWELSSRRCLLDSKRVARYRLTELATLIGASAEKRVRESIRRLERASLLTWSDSSLEFPAVSGSSADGMLQQIANNRRKIPVPRRMLRFMAGDAGRVVIATLVGHLLRCMYYRNGECRAHGLCKASWIGKVFGVDSRNVKAARKSLSHLGLILLSETSQWKLNRFGMSTTVNLAWGESESAKSGEPNSPPRNLQFAPGSPPPESNKELLSKYRNQKPASSSGPGSCGRKIERSAQQSPRLERIELADLRSLRRLRALFAQAANAKLVRACESGWMTFVAAAEHALSVADRNPCGLFRAIITRGLWRNISQQAEDAACARLKRAANIALQESHKRRYQNQHAASAPMRESRITGIVEKVLTSIRSEGERCGSWNHGASSKTQASAP